MIEVCDLTKTYPGGVEALRGISFRAGEGSVFALLGPNGAGKSTTVRILTTLSRPDRGIARVAGIDVVADPTGVRREIGVVSQASAVDPKATGRENLALTARLQRVARAEVASRVERLLDRFGLSGDADRLVEGYSGGMKRRLDVALALVARPRVLFLDEPTTGLDPEARTEMWHGIERLTRDEGVTVLLTTHYLEEADRLAAEVAIVDGGVIVAAGSPSTLKRDLQGDTIRLELPTETPAADALAALARLDGLIGSTSVEGRTIHARVDRGPAVLPAVLGTLDEAGISVAAATVTGPSLDDVYLSHTGRSLRTHGEDLR
jgi:ABC-2 type transport system ATP-binding protein